MKYLICSGDSYTDKDFRSSCYPDMDVSWPKWPEILGKKLNMKVINLGKSGSGNEYIYSSIQDLILNMPNKDEIGLVIAAWSQGMRRDYQLGNNFPKTKGSWFDERIDSHGDLIYWVHRSLRYYSAFQILCERYNLPFMQTQMIDLYIDYLSGLDPTEQEMMFDGKTWDDAMEYPGNKDEDEAIILKTILQYEEILNTSKIIGWPLTRKIGGFPLNREALGFNYVGRGYNKDSERPYVIDDLDNHPNAKGQVKIAEYIYDRLG